MENLELHNWAIKSIGEYYGLPIQKGKAIEELGELIVALQKDILASTFSSANDNTVSDEVIEEIADVAIMLEQLVALSKSGEKMNRKMEHKLIRQLNRIKEEQTK